MATGVGPHRIIFYPKRGPVIEETGALITKKCQSCGIYFVLMAETKQNRTCEECDEKLSTRFIDFGLLDRI